MRIKKEQINKANLKLEIAELIGELRGKTLTINGQKGQVIIEVFSLIEFLKKIQKEL